MLFSNFLKINKNELIVLLYSYIYQEAYVENL